MGEQLSRVLRRTAVDRLAFWCPACSEPHIISDGAGGWTWNGNAEKPTFSPSVKVTGYEISAEGYAMIERNEKPQSGKYPGHDVCCHSHVDDGNIIFCADCTHEHAGKSMPLADWPLSGDEG